MKAIQNFLAIFTLVVAASTVTAGDIVTFEIDGSYGINPSIPVSRIEQNTSQLLTAMNRAASTGSSTIDFAGIEINDAASYSLLMIWENVHMRTLDDDIIKDIVKLGSSGSKGYEVQNIAVEMKPVNPDAYNEAPIQEITLTFDSKGRISDFVISMGLHQYETIMKGAKSLEDIDMRQQILHFVEQFRTAYCEKDKQFLEDIFSDDALIITGRVRKLSTVEKGISQVVEYTKQSKRQYLNNLFKKFTPGNYINVKFDDIEIEHNPVNKTIYGVTVRQEWHSKGYSDVGTVFMLWDFVDPDNPKIYVRTWQPNEDTHRFKTTDFSF